MIVVADTNVLVSALLTRGGIADRILTLALTGELQFIADDRVVGEYREVLGRPKFAGKLSRADVGFVLAAIQIVSSPRALALAMPDPDDRPFLELASFHGCALITGNIKDYPVSGHGAEIIAPAQFLKSLAG